MNLNGKQIVFLGGTAGIGFATAAAAAQEGAAVVVVSSTQERVARAVADLPKGTEGYIIDLSNEDQIRDFFDRIGDFDHLVFTAGEAIQATELDSMQLDQARGRGRGFGTSLPLLNAGGLQHRADDRGGWRCRAGMSEAL